MSTTTSLLDPLAPDPEPRRDRWGRPLIPDPDTGKETAYQRVTTFAKLVSDTYHLSLWMQRMVAKGITLRPDLFALAASATLEDKDTLNKVAESAKEAAGGAVGANAGTAFHSFSERVDRGEPMSIVPAPWDADVRAYRSALEEAGFEVDRRYIERMVVVPALDVAGTFDRLLLRLADGRLLVGDCKSQKDMSFGHLEIAVQLAVYSRGRAIWNTRTREYEDMPEVDQSEAIVMHSPVGTSTCTLYRVDLDAGWQAAQLCADVRSWRARRGLLAPLNSAKAKPTAGKDAVRRLGRTTLIRHIRAAATQAELVEIWEAAQERGIWTDAATEAAKARKRELAPATKTPTSA